MGPVVYDAKKGWIGSHRGHIIFIWGASSAEVEYRALVCNHNYSRLCLYLL